MKKIIFIFIVITFLFSIDYAVAATDTEKEWYNSLIIAATIEGPTGLFNISSTKVVSKMGYCMGVHRYKFKYNVGLISNFEVGFMFDAEEFEDLDKESLKKIIFNAKYNLLKQENYYIDLSVGIKNKEFYTVAGRYFPEFYKFSFYPGLKIDRDNQLKGFFGLTKLNWRVLFISDFYDDSYSFGMRVLLSEKLKFDLFLINLEEVKNFGFNNIVFGLSFAE